MGGDDVPAAVASVILAAVAGQSMGRSHSGYGWMHPLMHVNFTVHGIIGLIHYQNSVFGVNTEQIFPISLVAAKCLSIAGLNADLYHRGINNNKLLPLFIVLSGCVPVYLTVAGNENESIETIVCVAHVCALAYYAFKRDREWAYYTLGTSIIAYLAAPASGITALMPLAFAAVDYCAFRIWTITL